MEPQTYDILIIGSGAAGAYAAIKAADQGGKVALVTKTRLLSGSTRWAQGGVAFPSDIPDIESHLKDTIAAGRGLVDEEVSNTILKDALGHLEYLLSRGISFDAIPALEGGHTIPRVRHINGDESGLHLLRFLHAQLSPNVSIYQQHFAASLLNADNKVHGVTLWPDGDPSREFSLRAKATIIATGGAGQLYQVTTNPRESTGDGIALAYRAGAEVRDAELVQFHPTVLENGALISEACRGEGAVLVNSQGKRFMDGYDPAADLAPRDIVARAIFSEEVKGEKVFLDLRPIRNLQEKFPTVHSSITALGLDPCVDLVPVHPAAHYLMGGITTDDSGATTVTNLYAAGEAASTGFHGANRLASNSLLESLVMGARAATAALKCAHLDTSDFSNAPIVGAAEQHRTRIKEVMTNYASVVREEQGLLKGFSEISNINTFSAKREAEAETANLRLVALLALRGAIERKESRGSHFRSDYPNPLRRPLHQIQKLSDFNAVKD